MRLIRPNPTLSPPPWSYHTDSTGIQTAQKVEVLSGLQEGELVVVGKQARYQPGEKVRAVVANLAETPGEH